MRFDLAGYISPGGREENEDATLLKRSGGVVIAAVADGLGGHGGGKIASEAALRSIEADAERLRSLGEPSIREACARANEAVLAAQTAQVRMKTTLALALVSERALAFAHVGDSRAYCFRQDRIEYQSADHSVSQLAVLAGEIGPEQIRFHEDRNKVLRALGGAGGANPDIRLIPEPLAPGDAVLLCTDGFWEYVTEREMLRALGLAKSAEEWLRRMTPLIRRRAKKGNDNNSAVAVLAEKPAKQPLWRGVYDRKQED